MLNVKKIVDYYFSSLVQSTFLNSQKIIISTNVNISNTFDKLT